MGLGISLALRSPFRVDVVRDRTTLSRITDWSDRNTAVLFADGSGAVVLEAVDGPGQMLSWDIDADGAAEESLYAELGGFIQMEGKLLFITNVLKFKKFNQIAGLKTNNDKIKNRLDESAII